MVRALQITRLWVEALDIGGRVLSLPFAAQLVNPRDLPHRQTAPFGVKGNREWAKIIGENQGEILPVLLRRPNDVMKIATPAAATPLLFSFGMDHVCRT